MGWQCADRWLFIRTPQLGGLANNSRGKVHLDLHATQYSHATHYAHMCRLQKIKRMT